MCNGGVAADAFGQFDRAVGRPALEELFQAPMDEPQSGLESQHGFAGHGKPEMSGFDQPGVHGTDRDLIHPGSLDGDEWETAGAFEFEYGHGGAAHGEPLLGPVGMPHQSAHFGM